VSARVGPRPGPRVTHYGAQAMSGSAPAFHPALLTPDNSGVSGVRVTGSHGVREPYTVCFLPPSARR
jgi:hypothetical protein